MAASSRASGASGPGPPLWRARVAAQPASPSRTGSTHSSGVDGGPVAHHPAADEEDPPTPGSPPPGSTSTASRPAARRARESAAEHAEHRARAVGLVAAIDRHGPHGDRDAEPHPELGQGPWLP